MEHAAVSRKPPWFSRENRSYYWDSFSNRESYSLLVTMHIAFISDYKAYVTSAMFDSVGMLRETGRYCGWKNICSSEKLSGRW